MDMSKLTPMMKQWHEAKAQHMDAILLFRMGDFYELFGQDAIIAAPLLELTLTSRDKDKSGLKMAGFPFHAAEAYIGKLVEQGHKVAICEQLEDPKLKVGVVKRGITNVVTPATALDYDTENSLAHVFLVSLIVSEDCYTVCALDYSSATFKVCSAASEGAITDEIMRLLPREIVISCDDKKARALSSSLRVLLGERLRIEERLLSTTTSSLLSDVSLDAGEQQAASLILSYVQELKGHVPSHISYPQRYSINQQLLMDEATRQNLDLIPKKKHDRFNLFATIDDNQTVMGKRALLNALKAPFTDRALLEERLSRVAELYQNHDMRAQLKEQLARFYDVEKLVALLATHRISPRGMGHAKECLNAFDAIKNLVEQSSCVAARHLLAPLPSIEALRHRFNNELADDLPLILKDGQIFKKGVFKELDDVRDVMTHGQDMLLALEAEERRKTGIASLKIKYTRVFGYYIEITKTNLDKVPPSYVRKQTIANGERYTTEELRALESKISSAESMVQNLEETKFNELVAYAKTYVGSLLLLAQAIADLDNSVSHASIAHKYHYVMPTLLPQKECFLAIEGGRHAIMEEACRRDGHYFVPNDINLDRSSCSLMLITGPNMGGKSTIMRQVALIQIMAQIGSFVPATHAKLSICDAIFARVGASDDMATKRSTFMVEMTEVAAILHNATKHSLILLDEIGRGTSTYDGLSIAQAVAEHIHDQVQSRTLFATHYHELTHLEGRLPQLRNFHVALDEKDNHISFLYKLAEGACLKSFGIEVARLSGLPDAVLKRAADILMSLEADEEEHGEVLETPKKLQPDLFGMGKKTFDEPLVQKLMGMDINRTTPLEALNKLSDLQKLMRKWG